MARTFTWARSHGESTLTDSSVPQFLRSENKFGPGTSVQRVIARVTPWATDARFQGPANYPLPAPSRWLAQLTLEESSGAIRSLAYESQPSTIWTQRDSDTAAAWNYLSIHWRTFSWDINVRAKNVSESDLWTIALNLNYDPQYVAPAAASSWWPLVRVTQQFDVLYSGP
jgi:hypothetical protein